MIIAQKTPCALLVLFAATLVPASVGARNDRVHLFPQLKPGQTFRYLIRYQAERKVNTQSNMVAPMAPSVPPIDARGQLVLEILDVQPASPNSAPRIRAHFEDPSDSTEPKATPSPNLSGASPAINNPETKFIEFTLLHNGAVEKISGLDDLTTDQQQSWHEWLSLFAVAGLFPSNGVKPSEKWKFHVAETSPAPIADLRWEKESTYVNDQPCGSNHPNETCAVILTKSILKQKSSPKDATPKDYKRHQLRTLGTASGSNETIAYISLKTGLVVRATEEAAQLMDVTVAKSDASNRVHYSIDAKSHSEILLLPDSPSNNP
jgi:hypothetical protein